MSGLINSVGSKSGIIELYGSNRPSFLVFWNTASAGAQDPVLFNDVSTGRAHNNGGHYSTSTGKFTAPVRGTYLFSIGGMKGDSSSVGRMELKVQNSASGLTQVRWEESSSYAWGSATNIVEMEASWYCNVATSNDAPWASNTFSGNNPYFCGILLSKG